MSAKLFGYSRLAGRSFGSAGAFGNNGCRNWGGLMFKDDRKFTLGAHLLNHFQVRFGIDAAAEAHDQRSAQVGQQLINDPGVELLLVVHRFGWGKGVLRLNGGLL